MKNKILSFILCLVLVFGSLCLCACNDKQAYNLSNLNKDYLSIAEEYDHVVFANNKLQFTYSNALNKVLGQEPYVHIKEYNTLLDNILDFSNNYTAMCSSNSIGADGEFKNEIKSKLDAFKNSFSDVNSQVKNLEYLLQSVQNDSAIYDTIFLNSITFLLNSYEELLDSAYEFNIALSRLYFTFAITDANHNYSLEDDFSKADAEDVLSLLNARITSQKTNLTYIYFENNLKHSNFAEEEISKGANCGEMPEYSVYESEIAKITAGDLSSPSALVGAFDDVKLQNFKSAAIKLFNIQACLDNDYNKYINAHNSVNYAEMKKDEHALLNASDYEKICIQIIDDYYYLLNQNTLALNELLVLIGEVVS